MEPVQLPATQRAAVAMGSPEYERQLSALATKHVGIATITNLDGYKDCHSARMEFKNMRLEVEKRAKLAREDAQVFAKAVIAEEKRLVAIVEPEEQRLQRLQDAWDEARQAERTAAIRAEQERVAAEELAKKQAEERRLAEAQAKLDAERAEFERRQAAARAASEAEAKAREEAAAKIVKALDDAARESRLRIEQEERAARMAREEQDRVASAQREAQDREAREKQERNQAALSEIQGIQQQVIIAQVGRLGVRAGGTIACIEATLAETEAWKIDAERFGFFYETAAKAKAQTIAKIRELLAAAVARQAEDAAMKAERERLEAARRVAEDEERRISVAKELKEAAERRAEEERQRAERDRLEAEARAKAEEERKVREAAESAERERLRLETELLDGREHLGSFVSRFGHREEFAQVVVDITEFLAEETVAA